MQQYIFTIMVFMASRRFQNMCTAILISQPATFDDKIVAYIIITIQLFLSGADLNPLLLVQEGNLLPQFFIYMEVCFDFIIKSGFHYCILDFRQR